MEAEVIENKEWEQNGGNATAPPACVLQLHLPPNWETWGVSELLVQQGTLSQPHVPLSPSHLPCLGYDRCTSQRLGAEGAVQPGMLFWISKGLGPWGGPQWLSAASLEQPAITIGAAMEQRGLEASLYNCLCITAKKNPTKQKHTQQTTKSLDVHLYKFNHEPVTQIKHKHLLEQMWPDLLIQCFCSFGAPCIKNSMLTHLYIFYFLCFLFYGL